MGEPNYQEGEEAEPDVQVRCGTNSRRISPMAVWETHGRSVEWGQITTSVDQKAIRAADQADIDGEQEIVLALVRAHSSHRSYRFVFTYFG